MLHTQTWKNNFVIILTEHMELLHWLTIHFSDIKVHLTLLQDALYCVTYKNVNHTIVLEVKGVKTNKSHQFYHLFLLVK